MGNIDRQRIEAVRTLEPFGYVFSGVEWVAPAETMTPPPASLAATADAMRSLLVLRADKLSACIEEAEAAVEIEMISDAVEAYEAMRWPDGKVPEGKA